MILDTVNPLCIAAELIVLAFGVAFILAMIDEWLL